MKTHASKGAATWQTRNLSNCTEYPRRVWMTTNSSDADFGNSWRIVESVFARRPETVVVRRTGRPHMTWSVNYSARAITKWNETCDKRVARLTSYIHFTTGHTILCIRMQMGLSRMPIFGEDLKDSKSTSGGMLCTLRSHTYVPTSWTCKKPAGVSHSSAELFHKTVFIHQKFLLGHGN